MKINLKDRIEGEDLVYISLNKERKKEEIIKKKNCQNNLYLINQTFNSWELIFKKDKLHLPHLHKKKLLERQEVLRKKQSQSKYSNLNRAISQHSLTKRQ